MIDKMREPPESIRPERGEAYIVQLIPYTRDGSKVTDRQQDVTQEIATMADAIGRKYELTATECFQSLLSYAVNMAAMSGAPLESIPGVAKLIATQIVTNITDQQGKRHDA